MYLYALFIKLSKSLSFLFSLLLILIKLLFKLLISYEISLYCEINKSLIYNLEILYFYKNL